MLCEMLYRSLAVGLPCNLHMLRQYITNSGHKMQPAHIQPQTWRIIGGRILTDKQARQDSRFWAAMCSQIRATAISLSNLHMLVKFQTICLYSHCKNPGCCQTQQVRPSLRHHSCCHLLQHCHMVSIVCPTTNNTA